MQGLKFKGQAWLFLENTHNGLSLQFNTILSQNMHAIKHRRALSSGQIPKHLVYLFILQYVFQFLLFISLWCNFFSHISERPLKLAPTCNLQAFVVCQFFSKEPGYNQFGGLHEADLLLHQSSPEHPSSDKLGGKIHLFRLREKRIVMRFNWLLW